MNYVLFLVFIAIFCFVGFYFTWQCIRRRRQAQVNIPVFLRKEGAISKDSGSGDPDAEWTEVYRGSK